MVRIDTTLKIIGYLVSFLAGTLLVRHLDLPVLALLLAAVAFGGYRDFRRERLVSPGVATVLSFAAFFVYAARLSRADPVSPLVNMLALLLGVRLVTDKSPRHYLQIFVLALFALAGSSLLSLSAGYLAFLIVQVSLVSLGLVLLCFFASDRDLALDRPDLRRTLTVAAVLPIGSLVLMLIFFAILPRTRYPLWNFLNPVETGVTGVGDKVSPGSVARLAETQEVAFRADSEEVAPEDLYWRVVVLNQPAGGEWIYVKPPVEEGNVVEGRRLVRQTIFPEPKRDGRLMILDLPREITGAGPVDRTGELTYVRRSLSRRIKYDAVSVPGGRLIVRKGAVPEFYLRLPENVAPRIREEAAEIKARSGSQEEIIDNLQEFFRGQSLTYATSGVPTGERPLESFLFEARRGYCEFFASSFALMLRLAGVPARLVGGYHGGTYNELAGYYLVTESSAHVWVEALIDNRSWRRIDPSLLSVNADSSLGGGQPVRLGVLNRTLDMVDYFWNQAVITYDLDRQLSVFREVGGKLGRAEWTGIRAWRNWSVLAAAVCLLGLVVGLWKRTRPPEERLLKMFLKVAQGRLGLKRIPPGMGMAELARRMKDRRGKEFAEILGGAVFRDRPLTGEQTRQLRGLIRGLRRAGRGKGSGGPP